MDVIPVVFLTDGECEVRPNREVSGYRWVGLDEFSLPSSAAIHRLEVQGFARELPAYVIGDYVIWGLTHRIISALIGRGLA
jgi:hypothetical protein